MATQILIYHALDTEENPSSIEDAADRSVVINAANFAAQLEWLDKSDKRVVSLEAGLSASNSNTADHVDSVVLTFDDGHETNFSLALPRLLDRNMVATFYVVAGFVDNDPEYVTQQQLREMASLNMTIGSHTMTHRWLPLLSPSEIRAELRDSKARLEDLIQKPVLDFALPGGHYNQAVLDAIQESEYRTVATSKPGLFRPGDDVLRLPRAEIRRGLSLDGFEKRFRRSTLLRLRLIEAAKTSLRNTYGLSRYLKLRQLAHRLSPNR